MRSRSSSLCCARLLIAEVRNRALGSYQAIGNVHRRRAIPSSGTRGHGHEPGWAYPGRHVERAAAPQFDFRPAHRAAPIAAASISGSGSTPVTRMSARANGIASVPGPRARSRTGSPGRKPTSTREIGATGEPAPARNTAQWCKSGANRSFRAARPWAVMFSGGADYITGTNTGWTENGNHRAR